MFVADAVDKIMKLLECFGFWVSGEIGVVICFVYPAQYKNMCIFRH